VVADLRFLQGVLASLTAKAEDSNLEPYEEHLYCFTGARSAVLGKVAEQQPTGNQRLPLSRQS
jgi:hypothetical protein